MSQDSFTEVTSQGWLSRIKNALKGIVMGLVLFVLSICLLWWNEGRAIHTAKGLEEGASQVISVAANHINLENEGKLIHVNGIINTEQHVVDSLFNIDVNALKLRRNVKMYQWAEHSTSETEKKLGGGTETVTHYTYAQEWSTSLISSSRFKIIEGHENPSKMPFREVESSVNTANLEAFNLTSSQIRNLSNYSDYPLTDANLEKIEGATLVYDKESRVIYVGSGNIDAPQLGDTMVTIEIAEQGPYSIIAQQIKNTFEPYNTKTGTQINMLSTGIQSAENMFIAAVARNSLMTWLLRLLGIVIMFTGLNMFLSVLVVLADVVPFIGNIIAVGTGIISAGVTIVCSALVIAIAWIFYRPLLAAGILVVCGAGLIFLYKRTKNKNNETNTATTK